MEVWVSWNTTDDLDLHIWDPTGFHLYWGQPTSPTGSTLDKDANGGCYDTVSNPYEHAYYPSIIYGTWSVHARLYEFCNGDSGPIGVTITVAVQGQPTAVYSGVVTTAGASGDLVDSFTITAPGETRCHWCCCRRRCRLPCRRAATVV